MSPRWHLGRPNFMTFCAYAIQVCTAGDTLYAQAWDITIHKTGEDEHWCGKAQHKHRNASLWERKGWTWNGGGRGRVVCGGLSNIWTTELNFPWCVQIRILQWFQFNSQFVRISFSRLSLCGLELKRGKIEKRVERRKWDTINPQISKQHITTYFRAVVLTLFSVSPQEHLAQILNCSPRKNI